MVSLTGKAGVPLTFGPVATSLMTGWLHQHRGAPLAITGRVGTDQMHEAHQSGSEAMFAPAIDSQIVRPSNTPEIVRKAFEIWSENPGAVPSICGKHCCHASCCKALKKDKSGQNLYSLPKYY